MKRYLLGAMALLGASAMSLPAGAQADYSNLCTWNETANPRRGTTGRIVRELTITGATNNGQQQAFSVEIAGKGAITQTKVFFDKTTSTLEATQGDQIQVTPSLHELEWMHFYLYIDYNHDGMFDQKTELVSYTHYREGGAGSFKNSLGETIRDGNIYNDGKLPLFRIPEDAQTGLTRVRFKVDWDNIDPCGNMSTANKLSNNRGAICDFMINIHAKEVTPPAPEEKFMITADYDKNLGEVEFTNTETDEVIDITKPVDKDTEVTIDLTPNEGYEVTSILVNGEERIGDIEDDSEQLEITITENTTIKVVFAPISYEFTLKFDETQVEVIAVLDDDSTVEKKVPHGTKVYLHVQAKEGFELTSVKINDVERIQDLDDTHTISHTVTENTTVVVEAKAVTPKSYTVTYSVKNNEGGELSVTKSGDGSVLQSGATLKANESIIVKPIPAEGYKLSQLLVNDFDFLTVAEDPTQASFELIVDADYVIEAVFVKNTAIGDVAATQAKVVAGEGAIIVEGAEAGAQIEVYSLSGKLVASVAAQGTSHKISVASGAYLVKIKSAVYKVHVK
ncbi:MAG: T9SS type A sorting domain-containing protein [Porphyromonadaceae bacterium]|nr:T9SS type A sorting domain-containing protein [Porphyromonadaceae bacterium]